MGLGSQASAQLAATSKKMPRGACPKALAFAKTIRMHNFHGMHAICTQFTLSIQSRHVLSSDIDDNFFYPLLPLPAIWILPCHDFVRLHCYITGSQACI